MAPKQKTAVEKPSKSYTKRNHVVENKPNWPALRPLSPVDDLVLTMLVPNQIAVIHNFFTATLSRTYVSFLSKLPLITTPLKAKLGNAMRVNDRYQVDDSDFAKNLWQQTGLETLVRRFTSINDGIWGGKPVGLNSNIRVYRYGTDQFFAPHCPPFHASCVVPQCLLLLLIHDESNDVMMQALPLPPVKARTSWTILIYLTSPLTGCIGGETVFYPESCDKSSRGALLRPTVIELEVGMILLHKHGSECLLHEGRKVTAGEKWVIRTDLCVV